MCLLNCIKLFQTAFSFFWPSSSYYLSNRLLAWSYSFRAFFAAEDMQQHVPQ
jgi:hypothetical protein